MQAYWDVNPPLHLLARAYLQYEPKGKTSNDDAIAAAISEMAALNEGGIIHEIKTNVR